MPTTARTRADACPGVVSPHLAADGALARIRLPGGLIAASALRAVGALASDAGDGAVHLTSRGNLQLRGLDPADPRPERRLDAAGLLPSRTHERVRNVLASPLSGIGGGLTDVRGLAGALDRALCARAATAALPGRFLFAIDDGRGDVAAERPDLCWVAVDAGVGELRVAQGGTGLYCAPQDSPALLVDAACAFLDLRATHAATPAAMAWRVAELPDATARVAAALRDHPSTAGVAGQAAVPSEPAGRDELVGLVGELGGGAVGAAPVLGELSAAQVDTLAAVAPEVVVTPWRTVVLPSPVPGAAATLRDAGLVVDPRHPALRISACAGAPGCAKSRADVRGDARAVIRKGDPRALHVAGCERRCGAPHTPHTDAVAVRAGAYTLDAGPARPLTLLAGPGDGAPCGCAQPDDPGTSPPPDRPRSHR